MSVGPSSGPSSPAATAVRELGVRAHRHLLLRGGAARTPTEGVTIAYDVTRTPLYKSQDGQDKWANENVFRGMTNGRFVDLGCYDGITYSNTCKALPARPCAVG